MAGTCTVITFCLWGLYFTREDHLGDDALRRALVWGYGHFAIFASGAAVGAGFAVFHETATGHADIGMRAASIAVAVPVAVYLAALWVVRDRCCLNGWPLAILPAGAVLVLATPLVVDEALVPIAALLVLATWLRRSRSIAAEAASPA
jgi:low temperature requirement protein LtrA